MVRLATPVLRYLEKAIRLRWRTPPEATKRVVGVATLIPLAPIPMVQAVPALLIALISLAYLKEDKVLLSIAFVIAGALLAITGLVV